MDASIRQEYRTYAWSYFELHAEHRLKAFKFFTIFAAILVGSFSTLIANKGLSLSYAPIPIALTFLSFIFWKLEERTRMLVKNGENALRHLDEIYLQGKTSPLALFANDEELTSHLPKWPLSDAYFSYSRVFRWVYGFFGISGLIGVALCAF